MKAIKISRHEFLKSTKRRFYCGSKNISSNITFRNIRFFGRHEPKIFCKGHDEKHKTKDILIDNLYWNDYMITELDEDRFVLGEFTENIRLSATDISESK